MIVNNYSAQNFGPFHICLLSPYTAESIWYFGWLLSACSFVCQYANIPHNLPNLTCGLLTQAGSARAHDLFAPRHHMNCLKVSLHVSFCLLCYLLLNLLNLLHAPMCMSTAHLFWSFTSGHIEESKMSAFLSICQLCYILLQFVE